MPDFSSWSPKDFALLGTALLAQYEDVQTTKDVIRRGGYETNPIFGTPHPTGAALDQGELAAGALTAGAAALMPSQFRTPFLSGVTALEAGLAYENSKTPGRTTQAQPRKQLGDVGMFPAIAGALAAGATYLGGDKVKPYVSGTPGKMETGIRYESKF